VILFDLFNECEHTASAECRLNNDQSFGCVTGCLMLAVHRCRTCCQCQLYCLWWM